MSDQQYALVGGELKHIGEYRSFVGISGKNRPKNIICQVCGDEMVMVLPKDEGVVSSHFRHKNNAGTTHSPESLWHSNVKYHLANRLNPENKDRARKIPLKWKCESGFCGGTESFPIPLISKPPTRIDIDKQRVGVFLPDITLYHHDEPVAAIEVCYKHKSTEEKEAYYKSINLPWIEINVKSESDFEQIMAWRDGAGLERFISKIVHRSELPDSCPSCSERIEKRDMIFSYIKNNNLTDFAELISKGLVSQPDSIADVDRIIYARRKQSEFADACRQFVSNGIEKTNIVGSSVLCFAVNDSRASRTLVANGIYVSCSVAFKSITGSSLIFFSNYSRGMSDNYSYIHDSRAVSGMAKWKRETIIIAGMKNGQIVINESIGEFSGCVDNFFRDTQKKEQGDMDELMSAAFLSSVGEDHRCYACNNALLIAKDQQHPDYHVITEERLSLNYYCPSCGAFAESTGNFQHVDLEPFMEILPQYRRNYLSEKS